MISEAIIGGSFAIIGVVIGGLMSHLNDRIINRRKKTERAKYLAARVILFLEAFIHESAECIFEEEFDSEEGPNRNCKIPKIPDLPSVDWGSIDTILAFEILSIPNRTKFAKSSVSGLYQVADIDASIEERDQQFLQMSLDAANIIAVLSEKYNLYSNFNTSSWPLQQVIERSKKFNESEGKQIEFPRKIFSSLKPKDKAA